MKKNAKITDFKSLAKIACEKTEDLQSAVKYMRKWATTNPEKHQQMMDDEGYQVLYEHYQHHARMSLDQELKRSVRKQRVREGIPGPMPKPGISKKARDGIIIKTLETVHMLALNVCGKTLGKCRKDELMKFGNLMIKSAEGHYYKGFVCLSVAESMKNSRKLVENEFSGRSGKAKLSELFDSAEKRSKEFTAQAGSDTQLALAGV